MEVLITIIYMGACAHSYWELKQSSIKSTMEIIKSDKLAQKIICKYTATSHIRITDTKEIPLKIFNALSSSIVNRSMLFNIPPPSRTEAGYRFISAKEMLQITKKSTLSPAKAGKRLKAAADIRLKIIPPS